MENVLRALTIDVATENGWLHRKMAWVGRRDAPDVFFAKNSEIVLVEFKQPGEKPRPMQAREHEKLMKAGVRVVVIDCLEAAYAVFDKKKKLHS